MFRFIRLAAFCAAAGVACFGTATYFARLAVPAAWAQPSKPDAAPTTVTAGGITLHSVSVEFPDRGRMFAGKDADAINSNCLACHSVGMVLTQPALSQTAWQAEVEKMRTQYKAPVNPGDVPAIVAYLTAHKGTK